MTQQVTHHQMIGLLDITSGGNAPATNEDTENAPVVMAGTGAPSAAAPKGSLYLRTDGGSVNTRAYINTNGSTSWTAVTTAT